MFVLAFALIGSYILLQIFAASPKGQPPFLKKDKSHSAAKIEEYKLLIQQGNKNVDILTRTVKHGHPHDGTKSKGQLSKISKDRINNLSALLEDDPNAVASLLLSDQQIADANTLPNVETEQKVTLSVYYGIDHFHDWKSGEEYTVPFVTPDGTTKYPLYLTKDVKVPVAEANRQLKIEGYKIGSKILATSITKDKIVTKSNPLGGLFGKAEAASGTYNVAVIVGNPSDVTNTIDMAKLQAEFNGAAGSDINSYFNEISYGRFNLAPSFYGPYQVPVTKNSGCNSGTANNTFANALFNTANADINYLNFARVIIIDGCGGSGGYASWTTAPSTTPDGNIVRAYISIGNGRYTDKEAITHELSHIIGFDKASFGNTHAARYICLPDIFDPPTRYGKNCDSGEYEDEFDVLGSKERYSSNIAGQTDTLHKDAEPFFNSGENVTLSTPGTYNYKIGPYESPTSSVKALTVLRGNSGTSFGVEYRQATGFDSFLSDSLKCPSCNLTQGASIRFNYDTSGTGGGSDTQLIDATPGSLNTLIYRPGFKDWNDAAFLPGKTFTDSEYGITISVGTPDASGLPINVTIPAQTCTHNAPNVVGPTSLTGDGSPFQYTITVTNNDSSGCQPNTFKVFPNGVGAASTALPDYLTLAPGASQTVTVYNTVNPVYRDNFYSTSVSVTSNSLGNMTKSISFTYNLTSAADTTAPNVPSNFKVDVKGSNVNILTWSASSDNLGVAGYTIYRDGVIIGGTKDTFFVDTSAQPSTSYSYYISAFDRKNNNSAVTSTINVSNPAKTDTTFPTVPIAKVISTDDHSVSISWSNATDNVGVAYYQVQGIPGAGILLPSTTSTNFPGLHTSDSYSTYVLAFDGDGNNSGFNPNPGTVNIMTSKQGTLPPSTPNNYKTTEVSGRRDILLWDKSTDDKGVTGYKVYLCDTITIGDCGGYLYKTVTSTNTEVIKNLNDTNYFYWVQATDGDGNTSGITDKIYTYVNGFVAGGDSIPPTVSLTGPANGLTVSDKINVTYTATDNNAVTGTVLYVDGNIEGAVNTSPAAANGPIILDTAKLNNGSHTLYVKSYDYNDNSATSSTITINVQNSSTDTTPPTVSLTSPASGSTVSGTSVPLSAIANDNVGVTKVEFLVDGTVVNTDTTNPYSFNWNSTTVNNGSHAITAKAYDAANNSTISSSATITTNNTSQKPGDINGDNLVNIYDFSILAVNWNKTGQTLTTGDLSSDGKVDITDLTILAANFGT